MPLREMMPCDSNHGTCFVLQPTSARPPRPRARSSRPVSSLSLFDYPDDQDDDDDKDKSYYFLF